MIYEENNYNGLLPYPHELNGLLTEVSYSLSNNKELKIDINKFFTDYDLLKSDFSSIIDRHNYKSNLIFADKFNIPHDIFYPQSEKFLNMEPTELNSYINSLINNVLSKRSSLKINEFNIFCRDKLIDTLKKILEKKFPQ